MLVLVLHGSTLELSSSTMHDAVAITDAHIMPAAHLAQTDPAKTHIVGCHGITTNDTEGRKPARRAIQHWLRSSAPPEHGQTAGETLWQERGSNSGGVAPAKRHARGRALKDSLLWVPGQGVADRCIGPLCPTTGAKQSQSFLQHHRCHNRCR
jgi:hypothetical protein